MAQIIRHFAGAGMDRGRPLPGAGRSAMLTSPAPPALEAGPLAPVPAPPAPPPTPAGPPPPDAGAARAPVPHRSRLVRLACLAAGALALALGLVGVVLPLLPTTPFVLLAAACFARGSTRVHAWLLRQRLAGPLIREWQAHRAMPRRAKRVAYLLMLLSFGTSILAMSSPWHRLMLAALGLVLLGLLWRVPTRDPDPVDPRSGS